MIMMKRCIIYTVVGTPVVSLTHHRHSSQLLNIRAEFVWNGSNLLMISDTLWRDCGQFRTFLPSSPAAQIFIYWVVLQGGRRAQNRMVGLIILCSQQSSELNFFAIFCTIRDNASYINFSFNVNMSCFYCFQQSDNLFSQKSLIIMVHWLRYLDFPRGFMVRNLCQNTEQIMQISQICT